MGEEIVFRGVILRQLERLVGTWWALVLTSAFFGAAHLGNEGATWFAALAIAMEAGILLGAAYLLKRRLWLAVGIHSAWNFTQGWVYRPRVRRQHRARAAHHHASGPEWLTGGAFGLEASAVAMVVATLAGVVMLVAVAGGHRARRLVQTASDEGIGIDIDAHRTPGKVAPQPFADHLLQLGRAARVDQQPIAIAPAQQGHRRRRRAQHRNVGQVGARATDARAASAARPRLRMRR
jgi:hypothetical protein